jgi:DNA polymerase III epsilon subunit-like protein
VDLPSAEPSSECLVSVDVETAGPVPAEYALLSIGACLVDDIERQFYVELQPTRPDEDPRATAIHGLSLARLAQEGVAPAQAMAEFASWVEASAGEGRAPVFVGFNAAFDWMFVADYFHRYLGHNPFGHSPLDIKAFYMGLSGGPFRATSRRHLAERYPDLPRLEHHALQDAIDQAQLLRRMQADRQLRHRPEETP